MKTDIRDVDGNYELSMELPGFQKENVKIQLKDGYLKVLETLVHAIGNDEGFIADMYALSLIHI